MTISTYSELLVAATHWLGTDLGPRVPEFVALAQARINRQVRVQAMETKSTTFSITAEYVNVPTDFLEAKNFYTTAPAPRKTLVRMDDEGMTDDYTTSGQPKYFSVVGSQFRFSPAPSATYTATLIYYAKPATLVVTSQETNSLFPTNADLYLYATLLASESFIRDREDPGVAQRLMLWKAGYDEALANINLAAKRASAFGGSMMTRPA